jgi:hypothetical protein
MAYSIENFAAPVLANAKKQNKKAEKKVGLQNLALLGVQVANQALRSRAIKRSEEFFNGAQPILQRAKQNVDAGFEFWGDHNRMLGDTYDPDDWRTAKAQQFFNSDFQTAPRDSTSSALYSTATRAKAFPEYLESVEVQAKLDSYKKEMDLHGDFKGGASADAREEIRTRYYGPIEAMITKETNRMAGDNTIVSSLMKSLNLKDDSRLDDIDVRGTQRPREDLSADEQTIMDFFTSAGEKQQRLRDISTSSTSSPEINLSKYVDIDGRERQKMFNNPAYGPLLVPFLERDTSVLDAQYGSGKLDISVSLSDTDGEGYENMSIHTLYNLLGEGDGSQAIAGEGGEPMQVAFARDVFKIASIIDYNWQHAAELSATVIDPPNQYDFVNAAYELVVKGSETVAGRVSLTSPPWWQQDYAVYKKLTPMQMTMLANNIEADLPEEKFDKLYTSRGLDPSVSPAVFSYQRTQEDPDERPTAGQYLEGQFNDRSKRDFSGG